MRRQLKQQAQEIVRLLGRVHNEIRRKLQIARTDDVLNLFEQCQNAAISLGETIELEEGEGFITVTFLEEYCETVYQIHEQILADCYIDPNKTYKILRKSLVQIENSIKNDIKIHIEILFLPYKASMWDSLESIWKAAERDPVCKTNIISIPYYDKFPDGSLGQMHDESKLYPPDVPVINWKDYDISSRHPDAIFIHYPYDFGNRVTTVHPDFYSSYLKANTDLLVYVPYYVTLNDLPEGFCVTPGTINADLIIVQSERVRKNYIYAFKKIGKEKNREDLYINVKKRILALGSPKFDKVIHSTRDMFSLPPKWDQLIRTGNKQRKIIFYNTSLGGILKGNKQYLKKLCSVLEIFRTYDEVLLWWRPHPLSEVTINSMKPELLQEYEQIIEKYQQEGWGIYDDTPDLHRAIAWSDAYYGDESSVTALFLAAGKPIMLQEVDDLPCVFENFLPANNGGWFTSVNSNGLFKINEKTWKATFMGCFPNEKDSHRLFFNTAQYENLLIFAPFSAEQIAIYQINKNRFISIPIKKPEIRGTEKIPYLSYRKFSVCTAYDGYAFLFPCTYPAIIKINLKTYETEYLYEPIAELDKIIKHPQSYYFRKGEQDKNIVKLWCVAANAFLKFDMHTSQVSICGIINDEKNYPEVVSDDMGYWLLPRDKSKEIQRVSKNFDNPIFIDISEGGVSEATPYLHAIASEDAVYIFPTTAKHAVKIDKRTNFAEIFTMLDSENIEMHSGPCTDWKYFTAIKAENTIFAYDAFSQKLILYDLKTGDIRKKTIWVDNKVQADSISFLTVWEMYYERAVWEQDLAVKEERQRTLPAFLKLLTEQNTALLDSFHKAQKRLSVNSDIQQTGTCGDSIYKYTKNYILNEQRRNL